VIVVPGDWFAPDAPPFSTSTHCLCLCLRRLHRRNLPPLTRPESQGRSTEEYYRLTLLPLFSFQSCLLSHHFQFHSLNHQNRTLIFVLCRDSWLGRILTGISWLLESESGVLTKSSYRWVPTLLLYPLTTLGSPRLGHPWSWWPRDRQQAWPPRPPLSCPILSCPVLSRLFSLVYILRHFHCRFLSCLRWPLSF
jgi:hypothetical protein